MADWDRQLTTYEIRCHACNVSFPPGTRACIHCGERIGRPRFLPGGGADMPAFEGGDPFPEADEVDPGSGGGRGLRVGFTLLWLLLAVASAAFRVCQGGEGP